MHKLFLKDQKQQISKYLKKAETANIFRNSQYQLKCGARIDGEMMEVRGALERWYKNKTREHTFP